MDNSKINLFFIINKKISNDKKKVAGCIAMQRFAHSLKEIFDSLK
jgi:hypothetical protein